MLIKSAETSEVAKEVATNLTNIPENIQEGDLKMDIPAKENAASESSTEKETETPASEGVKNTQDDEKLPFHKHPRWKALYNENRNLRKQIEDYASTTQKELADLKAKQSQQQPQSISIPDWFNELYGDNPVAWQKFQAHDQQTRNQIKQEILGEIQQREQVAQQESLKWNTWVDEALTTLGEEIGLNLAEGTTDSPNSTRNEILKIALDYQPTDNNGMVDLKKAYLIWKQTKGSQPSEKTEAKKKVADIAGTRSKGEAKERGFVTPKELRNKGFRDLIWD